MSIPLAYSDEKREVTPLTRTIRTAIIICACIQLAGYVNLWARMIHDAIKTPAFAAMYIPPRWYLAITNGIQSIALIIILVALIWPQRIKQLFGLLGICASIVLLTSFAGSIGVYLFPGGAAQSMHISWIIMNIIYPFKDVSALLLLMMWFERRSKRSL